MQDYFADIFAAWNRFWFTPRNAKVLSVMRILVGSMLLYTHLVWTLQLETFFSDAAILPADYRSSFSDDHSYLWSHFDWSSSPVWIWGSHILALIVFAMFTLGALTRFTSVLAYALVVSYANRASGTLFGLDQINAFLTLYLAIGNCGAYFSIDSKFRSAKEQGRGLVSDSAINTISTRLIQIHLCIVYLFAGLGKVQGTTWWNGQAVWGTLASYEYQTLDLTWLCDYMWLVNLLTYLTVAWEVSYAFLVWPKMTRPIVLAMGVIVHLAIGLGMGMLTFGLIMLYANVAFVKPQWLESLSSKKE